MSGMAPREVAVAHLQVLWKVRSALQMKVVISLRFSLRSASLLGLADGAGLKGSPGELPRGEPAAVFPIRQIISLAGGSHIPTY